VGAHLSVPVVLQDGSVYGTLCCFSHQAINWLAERDVATMRSIAELVARRVDATGSVGGRPPGDQAAT
jgi:hypothetical protein